MSIPQRLFTWLESHWVLPAYSGRLLLGLSIFFFAAATNTMAGWLYVISGVIFALLVIAAILPVRSLRGIQINRYASQPVTVGDPLVIEIAIANQTAQDKTLLEIQDLLPSTLGQPQKTVLDLLPANGTEHWYYEQPTQRRGIYYWQTLQLRTATPVGLFWCRRFREAKAKVIVYPTVIPLTHCPLMDELGRENSLQFQSMRRSQAATEGLTRALRPYRWGDPTRLIHWRTSARYGEFRVRELEIFTGDQEVIIGLDSGVLWQPDHFEQAVIAAASLYFYALRRNSAVKLWTAASGLVQGVGNDLGGDRAVLETLAGTYAGETPALHSPLPNLPVIWLTENALSLQTLPPGSRWILWTATPAIAPAADVDAGLVIQADQPLQTQLQGQLGNGG